MGNSISITSSYAQNGDSVPLEGSGVFSEREVGQAGGGRVEF